MPKLILPAKFIFFLRKRRWELFQYQKEFIEAVNSSLYKSFLISSDTGTGKTITLFLPYLIKILNNEKAKIIYVSPLRSIISDLYDRLSEIKTDLNLKITVSKRTGDESSHLKKKQVEKPVDILLTTPESLALMITKKECDKVFHETSYIAIDELSEIINTKRGDQLALTLSYIFEINKNIKLLSSSSNIQNLKYLSSWLSFCGRLKVINNSYKKKIELKIFHLDSMPDHGHSANYALKDIYGLINNKKTIIFVNTRAQSEILFNNLQLMYPGLKIGIYHSSLSKKVRAETEKKMQTNQIDSVISTSSLEMGIDWKNIDKIINIGAPKSVNRIIQRAGRSNHNYNGVSKSLLIPTNKFEYLECYALKNLISLRIYDEIKEKKGSKDVLCQHLLLISCRYSFNPDIEFQRILKTHPYKNLTKIDFYKIISFVFNGGYVLQNYENCSKLKKLKNGNYIIKNEIQKKNILLNAGTIIDASYIKIITIRGKLLGTVEESFTNSIKEKDIFIFAGVTLICVKIRNEQIIVNNSNIKSDKVPVYWGGNLPLKSNLSDEILKIINNYEKLNLPNIINNFINKQEKKSILPNHNNILIEKFPYQNGEYVCFHTFLGRETNQTLTNLIVNYLMKKKICVVNFVLNDYSFGLYFEKITDIEKNDFKEFFKFNISKINSLDTAIAKRIFKEVAMISGLIKKNDIFSKKRNHSYINSDMIFDTIRKYEPNHIILKITKEEIENHLSQSSQINKLKEKNFFLSCLDKCSEFSKSLIMEKEKIKANDPL